MAGVGGRGGGKRSPQVRKVITCSAPVYVLVFTCRPRGSRSRVRCPTRPTPFRDPPALFSHPRQLSITGQQTSLSAGVRAGQERCSKNCKRDPLGASFPQCTCVRVSQVRAWV